MKTTKTKKLKKELEKAKALRKVQEREMLARMQTLAKGGTLKKEKVFKTERKQYERFHHPITGKPVKKSDYAKIVHEYCTEKANEYRIPFNKMKGLFYLAKTSKKKIAPKKTFDSYFSTELLDVQKKLDSFYQEIDVNRLADYLPDNLRDPSEETNEENKDKYLLMFNGDYLTKAQFLFEMRMITQDLSEAREYFLFYVGLLTDNLNKIYSIEIDVEALMNIAENTSEIIYEVWTKYDKVDFRSVSVKFSSN